MNRPIYACDRCGHWFTTELQFAHNDLPYESDARHLGSWDFCAKCTGDAYALLKAWIADGKGVCVKPRGVR